MEDRFVEIRTLFGEYRLAVPSVKRGSERGELLSYFSMKTGRPIPYLAFRLTRLSVPDLYYLKSISDDYERQGHPWGKAFFGALKVKPV